MLQERNEQLGLSSSQVGWYPPVILWKLRQENQKQAQGQPGQHNENMAQTSKPTKLKEQTKTKCFPFLAYRYLLKLVNVKHSYVLRLISAVIASEMPLGLCVKAQSGANEMVYRSKPSLTHLITPGPRTQDLPGRRRE